jgi:quercetin dioxygenase-like cupin family protein
MNIDRRPGGVFSFRTTAVSPQIPKGKTMNTTTIDPTTVDVTGIARPGGPEATIIGPADGKAGSLGGVGVRLMLDAAVTGGGFSLVEHPIPPRSLAAPLHRHVHEDEYTYVLEGKVGALLGDAVAVAHPGDLVLKPRAQWHTFWNAGDEPARILEIIAPAGFDQFFSELLDLGGVKNADPEAVGELSARYGLEMDPDSVPELLERFGLVFGEENA